MAVSFFSLTFAPDRLCTWLREQVVVREHVDHNRLEALAKSIATNAGPDTRWALMAMRYGDDWFDPQWFDSLEWQAKLYHMVALAAQSRCVAGPDAAEVAALRLALTQVGWPNEQISLLLGGQPLDTLGPALHDPLFASAFDLGGYGGWLPVSLISKLHVQLTNTASMLLEPSPLLLATLQNSSWHPNIDTARSIRSAYLAAEAMLATSLIRREALYLVLD